jgi:hypothetical protein
MGYMVVNYLDDLGGAETLNKACDAYDTLTSGHKMEFP